MKKHHSNARCRAFVQAAGIIVPALISVPAGADATLDPGSARWVCDTHTVAPGDTLGGIAMKRTGHVGNTGVIFGMNADKITDFDEIIPGTVLKIPRRGVHFGDRNCGGRGTAVGGWRAGAGDPLVSVLSDWGGKAGYDVIVEHNSDWIFGVDFSSEGDFRTAVDEVVAGFSSSAVPPLVVFYNNGVMTIGVR